MRRTTYISALATALALGACDSATDPATSAAINDDYALVMFGMPGAALESTLGPQTDARPFDGRRGWPRLPDELALTDEQRAEIQALREAFRTEHQEDLEALRAVFVEARTAREGGATREEVRAILEGGREIAVSLRDDVFALHEAIKSVFTDEQLAWIIANRPRPPRELGDRRPRLPFRR
ncbi:MAG TPA: Spy/CpxP family protein refolding chaperone [Gemmatimonadaceae bacterium]|nr:Spy/CpxP family protein refolding chaperone [Gemmatimonadaceae bacterium]